MRWGFSGPEILERERRVRTLGLGAAVRLFNDIAVPGIGGIWFGKQLFLPLLGIAVAERARAGGRAVSNIEAANAIEAIACLSAYHRNKWRSDPRLRGGQKLNGIDSVTFSRARKQGFYVSQPMRMSSVEALLGLGFVDGESERFNAMSINAAGRHFLKLGTSSGRRSAARIVETLLAWVLGDEIDISDDGVVDALSPTVRLPDESMKLLREHIVAFGPGSRRRKAALDWINADVPHDRWETKPQEIAADHWRDMRLGARFFLTRDAAQDLLAELEKHMASVGGRRIPVDGDTAERIKPQLQLLQERADAFLQDLGESPDFGTAREFCKDCTDATRAIASLAKRDGRILRYIDGEIAPGSAFDPNAATYTRQAAEQTAVPKREEYPPGVSRRVDALAWLNLDLTDQLDARIGERANVQV